MNRAYAGVGVVLVLVLGLAIGSRVLGSSDDTTMIQETLRKSLEASRKGEPGGVLEGLSNSFKANDEEAKGNFGQIANYVKNQRPDIEVTNQTPIVTGDEARIVSPVKIKLSLPVIGDKVATIDNVTMVFKKETGRDWLVIPVKKWRLTEVQTPSMADLGAFGLE